MLSYFPPPIVPGEFYRYFLGLCCSTPKHDYQVYDLHNSSKGTSGSWRLNLEEF